MRPVLRPALGVQHVTLLNDLQAIANAVPFFEGDDLLTLSAGDPVEGGVLAVVAPWDRAGGGVSHLRARTLPRIPVGGRACQL